MLLDQFWLNYYYYVLIRIIDAMKRIIGTMKRIIGKTFKNRRIGRKNGVIHQGLALSLILDISLSVFFIMKYLYTMQYISLH